MMLSTMIFTIDTAIEILLIGAMPFLYGAATRLPFIYFVIHLDKHFKIDMLTIGFCVAMYQGARVVTSALAVRAAKTSHLFGTVMGLAGFLAVYFCDKDEIKPFVAGTSIIGFSETMSSMQKYAKERYENEADRGRASMKLRYQYASVMAGVVFAFSIGGFLYQYQGINGVAVFGATIEALGLASLLAFLALNERKEEGKDDDDVEMNATASPTSHSHGGDKSDEEDGSARKGDAAQSEGGNAEDRQATLRGNRQLAEFIQMSNANYATNSSLPVTWVNWIMTVSFGIEALTIGYNLSIGPIFMLDEFDKQTGIIGVTFAVGAALGTAAATGVTCTSLGRRMLEKISASPFDICFSMAGIVLGVFVAAVPTFPAHVCGVVALMCFNDLGATLMTELQASTSTTSNYSLIGPLGQVVRRSLNVVTALTGPVLFGVLPRLPYIVAGGVTLVWTGILFVAFQRRLKSTMEKITGATQCEAKEVKGRVSFALSESMRASMKNQCASDWSGGWDRPSKALDASSGSG